MHTDPSELCDASRSGLPRWPCKQDARIQLITARPFDHFDALTLPSRHKALNQYWFNVG